MSNEMRSFRPGFPIYNDDDEIVGYLLLRVSQNPMNQKEEVNEFVFRELSQDYHILFRDPQDTCPEPYFNEPVILERDGELIRYTTLRELINGLVESGGRGGFDRVNESRLIIER